jgi:uncharacterized protein (DUF697 family)
MDRRAAAEFLAAMGANVGAAMVLREGFRALMKVVAPGYGSVISGAIAFAGTMAIGAGARQFFLRGGTIEDAKKAFDNAKDEAKAEGEQLEKEQADKNNRDKTLN